MLSSHCVPLSGNFGRTTQVGPDGALKQYDRPDKYVHKSVLWIRIRMFTDLPDPDPSLFVFAWMSPLVD